MNFIQTRVYLKEKHDEKIISLSLIAFLFGSIYGQTREIAHKSLSRTSSAHGACSCICVKHEF